MIKDKWILINGELHPANMNAVGAANRAFRYADGLFETIRVVNGKPMFLEYHLERMLKGLKAYHIIAEDDISVEDLNNSIFQLLKINEISGSARVRLALYRADGGLYTPETDRLSWLMEVEDIAEPNYTFNSKGCIVGVFIDIVKPNSLFANLKNPYSFISVLASRHKKEMGWDEILLFNSFGRVAEAAASNCFVFNSGRLITPCLCEGCVDGVMRRVVIEKAKNIGLEVLESEISLDLLKKSDEFFLTNAIQGIRWVEEFKQTKYSCELSKRLSEEIFRG